MFARESCECCFLCFYAMACRLIYILSYFFRFASYNYVKRHHKTPHVSVTSRECGDGIREHVEVIQF